MLEFRPQYDLKFFRGETVEDRQKVVEQLARDTERLKGFFERIRDFAYLPTWREMKMCFEPFKDVYDQKNEKIGPRGKIDTYSIENEFHKIYGSHVYEILTVEFIEQFGSYIGQIIDKLYAKNGLPVRIVEMGAGNGRLSYFLNQMLQKKYPGRYEWKAIDSGQSERWGHVKPGSLFPIEQVDAEQALDMLNPQVVITSWMPKGTGWDRYYAQKKSVQEYILIGQPSITGGWDGLKKDDDGDLIFHEEDLRDRGVNKETIKDFVSFFPGDSSDDGDNDPKDALAVGGDFCKRFCEQYRCSSYDYEELISSSWFNNGFTFRLPTAIHDTQIGLASNPVRRVVDDDHYFTSTHFATLTRDL